MKKIPRKLKKRVIKVFGRGTYNGIRDGYLRIDKLNGQTGVITHLTEKTGEYYIPGQYNPRLTFPNINQYKKYCTDDN